jgi:hypothetical protein
MQEASDSSFEELKTPNDLPLRRRKRIELREEPLLETECVVCQRPHDIGTRKKLPKRFQIDGLPSMFFCSSRCSSILMGNKIERKKGQIIQRLHDDWTTSKLGTSVRVGSSVILVRDTSPNRLVEAGPGVVIDVRFDPIVAKAVFRVRHVLDGRVYEVTTSGFTAPAGEVSLPQRGSKTTRLSFPSSCPPHMVEEELQAARVALGGQQLAAAGARRRSQLDRTLRETAEATAVAERIRADCANASIGHIYARTERSIVSVEAASAVAASLLKSELEGVEAAAAAAAARADEDKKKAGAEIQVCIATADATADAAMKAVDKIRKQSVQVKRRHERAMNDAQAAAYLCEAAASTITT